MANEKNLKPLGDGSRTKSEERKIQSDGGKKSGESRRRKRSMKAAVKMVMDMAVSNEEIADKLIRCGFQEEDITNQIAIIVAMVNQAAAGNVKAAAFLRDTMGESPTERMHRSDAKLRREQFAYEKEKDAGDLAEIEDLDGLEADIYGTDTESGQEKSEEETDDSV